MDGRVNIKAKRSKSHRRRRPVRRDLRVFVPYAVFGTTFVLRVYAAG